MESHRAFKGGLRRSPYPTPSRTGSFASYFHTKPQIRVDEGPFKAYYFALAEDAFVFYTVLYHTILYHIHIMIDHIL